MPTDSSISASEEAARFELVLAAPHSKLRQDEDQTERLLARDSQPGRPHPGASARPHRRIARRQSSPTGMRCLRPRRGEGVAIEIDGDPARQDLDYTLAAPALAAGCLFALDSDAHTTAQLSIRGDRDRACAAGRHSRRSDRQLLAAGQVALVGVGALRRGGSLNSGGRRQNVV